MKRAFRRGCPLRQRLPAAARELTRSSSRVNRQLGEGEGSRSSRGHACSSAIRPRRQGQSLILRNLTPPAALHEILDEYTQLFEKIQDAEYIRERMADIQRRRVASRRSRAGDVRRRALTGEEAVICGARGAAAVAGAADIAAAEDRRHHHGDRRHDGHAAILSRSLAFHRRRQCGVLQACKTGTSWPRRPGGTGPHQAGRGDGSGVSQLQREYVDLRDKLVENRDQRR